MTEYPDPYNDNTQQPYQPVDYTNYANYQTFPTRQQQEQAYREQVYQTLQYQKLQPKAEQRISKAEALDIVAACKRWLIVASLALFGLLAILIGGQIANLSTQQNTTNPGASFGNNNTSSSGSGGFFQQQQGGSSFGNSSGQSQSPFSSTRTS